MEQKKKGVSIGIENFSEIRSKNCYYVDKTGLIKAILDDDIVKVKLITRPRRFGKTLNMSMLANFFSMDGDKHIFDGLEISKEKELCEKYMGKYPVIFISLKEIDAPDFETAYEKTVLEIKDAVKKASYLENSTKLNEDDKNDYNKLKSSEMTRGFLDRSLKLFSQLLQKHHGKKVVILIDEYDVPLQKAYANGYYDQMVSLIRSILSAALKSTDSLVEFAVLTGCLRVSKEIIFTGLNNMKVFSVKDENFAEYFGFTDEEVRSMLDYYGLSEHYDTIKEWYDGYQFGDTTICCPWDVTNYCYDLRHKKNPQPECYWINTSENDEIMQFVRMADGDTRDDIGDLLAGEIIEREIHEEITYKDMYSSIDNLWSLLCATGYITQKGVTDEGKFRLAIPNLEVLYTFDKKVTKYLDDSWMADIETLYKFYRALQDGDAETVEELFTAYLDKSIGVRDYAKKKDRKEAFYHGTLTGVLAVNSSWEVLSNREAGDGYADILIKSGDGKTGLVVEMKYVEEDNKLDNACLVALKQIEDRRYASYFGFGMTTVRKYAIVCYKKRCRVMLGE